MSRRNFYVPVHKGVRAALVQAASLVARTDFTRPAEAAEAARVTQRLVFHLESHASHEDHEIMPVLARIAPELHADLQAEHTRTDGLQREAAALAERILAAGAPERPSLGQRLHQLLWRLAGEHLRHVEREETEAMRVLWAHCTDEELEAMERRILASIPPEEAVEWGAIMLPALSLPERTAVLAPLARTLPRPAFEAVIAPVRTALGERWPETAAAIGL
jgi:hypothetical protein